ncbi:hypothetical protein ABT255_57905 [Streptomyces mirabilis]|uniref:hypothetical protein n=1 Tax=Streptomyces mirabilis TaxID=68239 RepID=UPI0033288167
MTITLLTLTNNKKTYDYGKNVVFTAHLGTTYSNRTVELWADPYGGDKPNKLLKTGKTDAYGNLSATVTMSRDTAVTAVFKGDARYSGRTVKSTAYAHVKTASSPSKYYRTATIGSTRYRYYHKNTDAVLTTTMTYYKGRKERLDLQVYSDGKWYTTDSEYFSLGTNGKSIVNLGHPGKSGIRARVRTSYIDPSSGDNVNTTHLRHLELLLLQQLTRPDTGQGRRHAPPPLRPAARPCCMLDAAPWTVPPHSRRCAPSVPGTPGGLRIRVFHGQLGAERIHRRRDCGAGGVPASGWASEPPAPRQARTRPRPCHLRRC